MRFKLIHIAGMNYPSLINIDNVTHIVPLELGSKIHFNDNTNIIVRESLDQIIEIIESREI